jgi:hypothetical protein
MAKKTKKYANGGDVYEGTDLARSMGVRGVPEPGLEELHPEQYMGGVGSIKGVGGSALKAVVPKVTAKEAMKRADDFFIQEEAKAQARFAANKTARQAEIDQYAKNKALESAKDQQRRALKKANITGKEPPPREGRVNPYVMQEPGVSYRPLDHKDVMRNMGEFKKGGKVKAKKMASGGKVSQLAKANGIAVRGKSRGRII